MPKDNNCQKPENSSWTRSEIGRLTFDGDQRLKRPPRLQTPKLIQVVVYYSGGYIKSAQQAHYVLLGIALLAVIISVVLITGGGEGELLPPVDDIVDAI